VLTARLFERSPELPVATSVSGVMRHNAGGSRVRKVPVALDGTVQERLPCEPVAVSVMTSPGRKWPPQMAPEIGTKPGAGPPPIEGQNPMMAWAAGGGCVGGIGVGQPTGRGASVKGGGQGEHPSNAGAVPMSGKQGRQTAIGRSVGTQVKGGSAVPGAVPDRAAGAGGCGVSAGPDDSR
jgi:hypothetical protein